MSIVFELEEYKFGFYDDVELVFSIGDGLIEDVVCEIFCVKGELEWMFDFCLKLLE